MSNVSEDALRLSPIPPAKTKRKRYDVLRPHVAQPVRGFCLHQDLIPVETHWHPRASGKVRHLAANCHWCEFFGKKDIRWYGYMPAWSDTLGKVVALEITHQAALDCPQLSSKRVPLRGLELTLTRLGKADVNRVACSIKESYLSRQLPPAIDEADFLEAIFEKCERVPAIGGPAKYEEEVQP